ncbi:Rdx family protein [Myxococcota bacterium]|nr:Rdx family protein [Myxococcota bacterium]
MAAVITDRTGWPVALVPGDRGEFTVWVGDRIVARKTLDGFPEAEAAAEAVVAALGESAPASGPDDVG